MSINKKKKALVVVVITPLLAAGFIVGMPAAPSQAAMCVASTYVNYTEDYARITNLSGSCSQVMVRHQYNVMSASKSYWTSWIAGRDYAQTARQAELSNADFNYF